MRNAFVAILLLITGTFAQASFEIEGVARDSDGKAIQGTFDITLKVIPPSSSSCVLYEETHPNVQSDSLGFFTVIAGSAKTAPFPEIEAAISNSFSLTCKDSTTFTPDTVNNTNAARDIHVSMTYNGSTYSVGTMPISRMPLATEAARIGTHSNKSLLRVEESAANQLPVTSIVPIYRTQYENILSPLLATPTAPTNKLFGYDANGTLGEYKEITGSGGISITHTPGGIAIGTTSTVGTVTNIGVSGLPLSVSTSSTSPTISIALATTSTAGYLSSADWNTFSGKQAAGNYLTGITGDVVATGPGSVTATIQANAVTTTKIIDGAVTSSKVEDKAITYAKIQDMTTGKLLGRSTAGAGPVQELSIGSGLTLASGTLSTSNNGTVTGVSSANNYITVANNSTTPLITAVVGTAVNTLAAGDDSRITGALQKAGDTMSGDLDMGTKNITNVGTIGAGDITTGSITMAASKNLQLGTYATDPTLSAADEGKTWYNTTSNEVKYWDGTAAKALGVAGAGITGLTGDVTASGTGSVSASVGNVGGSTAANVHTATVAVNSSATDASTASVLVKRDASGNSSFKNVKLDGTSGGTLTIGVPAMVTPYTMKFPAAVAAAANSVLASDTSGNLTWIDLGTVAGSISLTSQVTGVLPVEKGGTNSSTALGNNQLMFSNSGAIKELGVMTDGQIVVGKTSNAPQIVSMSGDVTITNTGVTTIGKINNTTVTGVGLANNNVLQNNSGSPIAGNNLLISNGTASGVTALTTPVSGILTSTGSVPTWSSTIGVANGGTGATSLTDHGVLFGSGTGAVTASAAGSAGQILRSGGAAADPAWSTATYPATVGINELLFGSTANGVTGLATANTGTLVTSSTGVPSWALGTTANRVLRTNGTAVSFGQVALTTDVTGTLPVANGGTGASTLSGYVKGTGTTAMTASTTIPGTDISGNIAGSAANVTGTVAVANGGTGQTTAAAGFNALSPLTTLGDVLYGGASGAGTRLAGNTTTTKQFLSQTGNGTLSAAPVWSAIAAIDVTNAVINGGNTGAVTVGTNNATSLTLETNGAAALTVLSGGNVGVGTAAPTARLEVSGGSIVGTVGTTLNFSTGNIQVRATACNGSATVGNNAIALSGLQLGGVYTLIVTVGTTSPNPAHCWFSGYDFRYPPGYGATIYGKATLFSFMPISSTVVYVSWIPGYDEP